MIYKATVFLSMDMEIFLSLGYRLLPRNNTILFARVSSSFYWMIHRGMIILDNTALGKIQLVNKNTANELTLTLV